MSEITVVVVCRERIGEGDGTVGAAAALGGWEGGGKGRVPFLSWCGLILVCSKWG